MKKIITCVFFLILGTATSLGQETSLINRIKKHLAERQLRKDSLIAAGRPFLSAFAGPGYTPEAGLLLGGGLLYTFSTEPENKNLQRSSIPLLGSISTRGNVGLNSAINTFWNDDKLRVKIAFGFSNVNDDYFGIGYENNSTIEKGENSGYNRVFFKFQPRVDIRLIPNLYVGFSYLYNSFKVKETNDVMAVDPNFVEFGSNIRESGFIYSIMYDSRDVVVNAYKGFYFESSFYQASKNLGGNQKFNVIDFDTRYYQQINRPGNTLAFRIFGRQAMGKVPYSAMTLIGATDKLRGYLNGQYRDKTGLIGTSEWRYMFLNKQGIAGKHGIVTWLGIGSVANDFTELNNWLPNAGVGYRFELQPRMNLRIDVGVGKNSAGLYFNFSEAF